MNTSWRIPLTALAVAAVGACSDARDVTAPGPLAFSHTTDEGNAGALYVATNASTGNAILVFLRASDGTLSAPSAFVTGGKGSGGGLGNQGGVSLTRDKRWLLVVNAGSNEVSVFAVKSDGLELTDRVLSGGEQPISVTAFRELVYVLNAGGTGNITGFRLTEDGRLRRLRHSRRPLSSGAAGAAQVEFSPDGEVLVVTEKATNTISTYAVKENGRVRGPNPQPSAGPTPFGFSFSRRGTLVVSEAFGGSAGASALSSYEVAESGTLEVVSASVGTTQTAACWVVITRDSRFAYTTNTGSATISGYSLSHDGALERLAANGVTGSTGPGPIDMALSRGDRFLYTLNSGDGSISAFRVNSDGSLTPQAGATGLPAGANGLAAR
jgi:6-phosphogluconolactonase (cycloisomerase 2 family)